MRTGQRLEWRYGCLCEDWHVGSSSSINNMNIVWIIVGVVRGGEGQPLVGYQLYLCLFIILFSSIHCLLFPSWLSPCKNSVPSCLCSHWWWNENTFRKFWQKKSTFCSNDTVLSIVKQPHFQILQAKNLESLIAKLKIIIRSITAFPLLLWRTRLRL